MIRAGLLGNSLGCLVKFKAVSRWTTTTVAYYVDEVDRWSSEPPDTMPSWGRATSTTTTARRMLLTKGMYQLVTGTGQAVELVKKQAIQKATRRGGTGNTS